MSRAVPCIGSAVGGIPELLDAEDLVPPGSAGMLAQKIVEVSESAPRRERMSRRCLERAREFTEDRLEKRRREFCCAVLEATRAWKMSASARRCVA